MRFDFTVYDRSGRARAIVEAKRMLGTDTAWARQLRSNWLEHGPLPAADLFVVVVPDRIYIWNGDAPAAAGPLFDIDARPLLGPYFERIGISPEQFEPRAFEMLVAWWLRDLARKAPPRAPSSLMPSALQDAVAGGQVVSEAAA
jgi:hypothetical protein